MKRTSCSYLFALFLFLPFSSIVVVVVDAKVSCTTDTECEATLRPGSTCGADGYCTNPFYKGGCLAQMLAPDEDKKAPSTSTSTWLRVCHSDDPPDAAAKGVCRLPYPHLEYPEIRIATANWESSFFISWLYQILLTELLGVPATIETGQADKRLDFYALDAPFDYGVSYCWECLTQAAAVPYGDCRKVQQQQHDNNNRSNDDDTYIPCAHILPEVWNGQQPNWEQAQENGTAVRPQNAGLLGLNSWYLPRFTGQRDPSLLSYLGLAGEENRHKLAARFNRPTKWDDYCQHISSNNCTTPDQVAQRAPLTEVEANRMFVQDLYTGYFRPTERNNCTAHPDTCTGHIADYPCGWSSFVKQQTYHNRIALESNGDEPISHGYTYSQLTEIWAAANATKSDVIMVWWRPEALYQTYLGTDAEFLQVNLPPTTQKCLEARVNPLDRCSTDTETQVGSADGACAEAAHPLKKILSTTLFAKHEMNEARQSPAPQLLQSFEITEYQLGVISEYWLNRGIDKWNYDPREAVCRYVVENFEWFRGFVPEQYPRVIHNVADENPGVLMYISLVVGSLAVLFSGGLAVAVWRYRRKTAIALAQVEFIILVLLGLFLVALGSLVLAHPPTDAKCVAIEWLRNVGYTMELIPLIIKISAINHLAHAAKRCRRVTLDKKHLLQQVFFFTFLIVIFMICWTIFGPPHEESLYALTDQVTSSGETVIEASTRCHSESEAWTFASLGWQALLLLAATIQAFQGRRVRNEINESQTLAMMIYSQFVFVMLRSTVYLLGDFLPAEQIGQYQSLIHSVDVIATCMIYFVPKFLSEDGRLSRRFGVVAANSFHGDEMPWDSHDSNDEDNVDVHARYPVITEQDRASHSKSMASSKDDESDALARSTAPNAVEDTSGDLANVGKR